MAVRVAINGFGRIGRLAFRQMFQALQIRFPTPIIPSLLTVMRSRSTRKLMLITFLGASLTSM